MKSALGERSLHFDVWSFDQSDAVFGLVNQPWPELLRGGSTLDYCCLDEDECTTLRTESIEKAVAHLRALKPSVAVLEAHRANRLQPVVSLRFVLSPLHNRWRKARGSEPLSDSLCGGLFRLARSVAATVGWNEPTAFPTFVSTVVLGDEDDLRSSIVSFVGLLREIEWPGHWIGVAELRAANELRLGVREFLAEAPQHSRVLERSIFRLHEYTLLPHHKSEGLETALKEGGAILLGEGPALLWRTKAENEAAVAELLRAREFLLADLRGGMRAADEKLGEFRTSDGRLFLSRRRRRELSERGFDAPLGERDVLELLPGETHCLALGRSPQDSIEIVVDRDHAARLRALIARGIEESAEGATIEDLASRLITAISRALRSWPAGGFFGTSTSEVIRLLERIIGSQSAE